MKRIILFLIFIINILSFGEENKVSVPLKSTDMYLYKNLDSGEYSGVYTRLLDGVLENIRYKVDDSFYTGDKDLMDKDTMIIRTHENSEEKNYLYVPTPITYRISVITKKDKFIRKMNDLQNMRIGYINNSQGLMEIKGRYKNIEFISEKIKNREIGVEKLLNDEIDALVVKNWLNFYDEDGKINVIENIGYREYIAINSEKKDLYEVISNKIKSFSNEELDNIITEEREKYYQYVLKYNPSYSKLKSNYSEIKVGLLNDEYMIPFYYNIKSEYKGISVKIIKEMENILGIPFVFTNKEANLGFIGIKNKEDKENYYFTKPYYETKIAIANRSRDGFVGSISDLDNKIVIIPKDSKLNTLVLNRVKNSKILEVDTYQDGLNELLNGNGEYLIGYFGAINGIISNNFIEDKIKIAGILNEPVNISMSIKKDEKELYKIVETIMESYDVDKTLYDDALVKNVLVAKNYKLMAKIAIPTFIFIVILIIVLIRSEKNRKKAEELGYMLVQTLEMANKLNDEDTGEHTKRLGLYSEVLATDMNKFTKEETKEIKKYAVLHDIGKVLVPGEILKKPGKLTEEEFNIVKGHVSHGYGIVCNLKLGNIAENIVKYHHEKWDGKGYPENLKGNEIPKEAAVVGLADMYDALRQEKSYKRSFSHKEAVDIIKTESGRSFDPEVVEAFLRQNTSFDRIYEENKDSVDLADEFYSAMK